MTAVTPQLAALAAKLDRFRVVDEAFRRRIAEAEAFSAHTRRETHPDDGA